MRRALLLVLGAACTCRGRECPPAGGVCTLPGTPGTLVARLHLRTCIGTDAAPGAIRLDVALDGAATIVLPLSQYAESEGIAIEAESGIHRIGVVARRDDGSAAAVGTSASVSLEPRGRVDVPVALSPTERFAPLALPDDPGRCASLRVTRAGHTLSAIASHFLLAAGGYQARDADVGSWTYLDSAELHGQETGVADFTNPMKVVDRPLPRAFHAAFVLADGSVLVVGGEARQVGSLVTYGDALRFDVVANAWTELALNRERTRGGAAADGIGRILLSGGFAAVAGTYAAVDTIEWFDPKVVRFVPGDATVRVRRAGHGMALLDSGRVFVLASGIDSAARLGDLTRLKWNAATGYLPEPATAATVDPARYGANLLKIGEGAAVLVGGFESTDPASPTLSTDKTDLIIEVPRVERKAGPSLATGRGRGCAAYLPDGRALYVGGMRVGASMGTAKTVGDVTAFTGDANGATATELSPLVEDRADAACVALLDGSVIVAGGVQVAGGTWKTLSSMEKFVPAPAGP